MVQRFKAQMYVHEVIHLLLQETELHFIFQLII